MATFRGFITASGSWAYWDAGEAIPAGVSLISLVSPDITTGTSINFSSSLAPSNVSGLTYNFDFTQGIANSDTNVTDSVSGFVIDGNGGSATAWQTLLDVGTGSINGGGAQTLSQYAVAANNSRKFIASGSNSITMTGSFSVECLVKHNESLGSTWDWLAGNYTDRSWAIWKRGSGAPNKVLFDFQDTGLTAYQTNSSSSLPLAEWVHIVCTREVTSASSVFITQSIYINGTLDAQGTFANASPIFQGPETFYLGGNGVSGDNWNGEIIFVRIYENSVLSDNDISQLYSASLGKWQNEWLLA